MSELDPTKRPQYELRANGEIHLNRKGQSQLLAKYDEERGIVTFESFAIDQKYRTQVCRAIMEDIEGVLTGNAIKAYAIAGRPVDTKKPGEPLPPKKDKMMGDKTEAYVKWLYKWRPQAFYARYGVFLDSNGDPITANCIRTEQGLLKPSLNDNHTVVRGGGQEVLSRETIEAEDGILAMRGTCLTFTKNEVVGATSGDDEEDEEPVKQTEEEPTPDAPEVSDAPKARNKPGPKPKAQPVTADDIH